MRVPARRSQGYDRGAGNQSARGGGATGGCLNLDGVSAELCEPHGCALTLAAIDAEGK